MPFTIWGLLAEWHKAKSSFQHYSLTAILIHVFYSKKKLKWALVKYIVLCPSLSSSHHQYATNLIEHICTFVHFCSQHSINFARRLFWNFNLVSFNVNWPNMCCSRRSTEANEAHQTMDVLKTFFFSRSRAGTCWLSLELFGYLFIIFHFHHLRIISVFTIHEYALCNLTSSINL